MHSYTLIYASYDVGLFTWGEEDPTSKILEEQTK